MFSMYMEFIYHWSKRQPREALRFIGEIETEEYQELSLQTMITSQSNYHPELVVEALEMGSLKRFQEKVLPEVVVSGLKGPIPWPLIDENVPLSREVCFDRLKQAVESSTLPESLKERFFRAIEVKRGK